MVNPIGADPKTKLTDGLTNLDSNETVRSDFPTKEVIALVQFEETLGVELEMSYFQNKVKRFSRSMVSFERKGRGEFVSAMGIDSEMTRVFAGVDGQITEKKKLI